MNKKIIVFVGSSGSGKTMLGNYCKESGIPELVSHTTRAMRAGEINGETYNFVSQQEFEQLEKIEETRYAKNSYCLSTQEVTNKLKENSLVFSIMDIYGYQQLKAYCSVYNIDVIMVFVDIKIENAIKNMISRGDSAENILQRIENMIDKKESENIKYADFVINSNCELSKIYTQLSAVLSEIDQHQKIVQLLKNYDISEIREASFLAEL